MERRVGTISRGIRCPIIREGDNLVDITVESVLAAAESEGFSLRDRDVIALTESIVARAQGNYVSVEDIAADVKAKLGGETVGVIFSDKIHALSKLKEAIEICPQFTEALRKFISHYPDLEQERARKQQEEMNALRNQVLAQANAMLEGGQVQEAISVLHQLAQIMPNDLEIQSLILQAQMKVED